MFTPDGKKVGESKSAAKNGIAYVCISRVLMAVPGMSKSKYLYLNLEVFHKEHN